MELSAIRTVLACFGLGAAVFAAFGQQPALRPDMPRSGTPSFDPGVIFDSWDRNGDGVVTRDELPDRRALFRFEEFVRRAGVTDGKLTREAFLRAFHERMAELTRRSVGDAERLMRFYDRDGDGKLSAQELQTTQRLKDEIPRWDRNNDGMIDLTELQAVLEAYAQERLLGVVV
ncbi:MAG: EF-hand domain-containing protein, partial [Gemmatales bacterium]|nr:EF-hand domain-containing protein [Gemmatales bacterium]MDW8388063.1 EF-hand domain-containing protein [Gemmatales bacterium]